MNTTPTAAAVLLQGTSIHYTGPEPLPVLDQGQPINFACRGEIVVEAEQHGGISIGKRFLSSTNPLNVTISAENVGPVRLSSRGTGLICATTILVIGASVEYFTLDDLCMNGGVAVHRINVETRQPLPLIVKRLGKANFFDFELAIGGEQPGSALLQQNGNALWISDKATNSPDGPEMVRLIEIGTREGV